MSLSTNLSVSRFGEYQILGILSVILKGGGPMGIFL